MKTFILVLLFSVQAVAGMAEDSGHSEENITKILMTCAIKLMEGESVYLGKSSIQDNIILKHYPRDVSVVTEEEKAERIIFFTKCQELANIVRTYEAAQ